MPFTRIRRDDLLSGSVGSGSLATGSITGLPEATSADNSDLILIFDDNVSALNHTLGYKKFSDYQLETTSANSMNVGIPTNVTNIDTVNAKIKD